VQGWPGISEFLKEAKRECLFSTGWPAAGRGADLLLLVSGTAARQHRLIACISKSNHAMNWVLSWANHAESFPSPPAGGRNYRLEACATLRRPVFALRAEKHDPGSKLVRAWVSQNDGQSSIG
jgi:hypothetical protein